MAALVLAAVLLVTVFEGAIRKWMLNGVLGFASYAVYLSKDALFVSILIFPKRFSSTMAARYFRKGLMLAALLVVLGAILSSVEGISPVGAALTLRSMILLPLISLLILERIPPMAATFVVWTGAACGVVNCIIGVVQSRLPPEHFLNQYAIAEMQVVTLTTGVRAAGTFAFITGLAVMSTVSVWAGLCLISTAETLLKKTAGWVTIVAGLGCALASVSRAPLVIDGVMILGWALFARLPKQRVIAAIVTAAIVIFVAAMIGFLPTAERLSDALLERTVDVEDDAGERAFGQTEEAITAVALAPLGNGLGFEQVGGNYFSTGNLAFANFEGQFPRIVMDTTVLGLIGYAIICLSALYSLQIAKREVSSSTRAALWATQLLLASVFYGSEVSNHTASSFAWIIFAAALASANRPVHPAGLARAR